MDGWQIALLVSALLFGAFMIFKMRPAVTPGARAMAAALADAHKQIEAAKDETARAKALADAGDACARLGRTNGAIGFYLRALREDPASVEIVERAGVALARRPVALEQLMWRHLAARPWSGSTHATAIAGLKVLRQIYSKKHRHHFRAEAIEHALVALGAEPAKES
jgi:hypothetical protein